MYYKESIRFDRRNCSGSRSGPSPLTFDSHDVGTLKSFFSQYEQYNDSNVSVSISPGYYDLTITVHSNVDKGDSWCNYKLDEAMKFVKNVIVKDCRAESTYLDITIELYA